MRAILIHYEDSKIECRGVIAKIKWASSKCGEGIYIYKCDTYECVGMHMAV